MKPSKILLSRRKFLSALGTAAGVGTFGRWLPAFAAGKPGVKVRYEASSPEGLAMLQIYRKAVGTMLDANAYPMHHPYSWRFQANTHQYPQDEPLDTQIFQVSNQANAAEIRKHRILALGTDTPAQTQPTGVWATCPHADPEFLPWHRLYIAYFEAIVEKVAGVPFSLPYWNYLDPKRRTLPEPFRDQTVNGAPNSLYFPERTPQFLQSGLQEQILDALQPQNVAAMFANPQLLDTPRVGGFSGDIEDGIHNGVHSTLGTGQGMGSPLYASRDPIFWLHHANIDRLWESWRAPDKDGRSAKDPEATNPWRNVRWGFASTAGERDEHDVSYAVLALINMGFQYDKLERVAPAPTSIADQAAAPFPRATLHESIGAERSIRTPSDVVSFEFAPSVTRNSITAMSQNPRARFELVIDLNTKAEPGLYQVFVKLPERQGVAPGSEKQIGSFSLFSAGAHQHHGGSLAPAKAEKKIRIDITEQVKNKTIDPAHPLQVTIRPNYLNEPVDITVKSISIVAK